MADGSARDEITQQMTEQLTTLHRLVHHGARATGRQIEQLPVRSSPEAEQTVLEMQQALEEQDAGLERRLETLDRAADAEPPVAEVPCARGARASEALEGDHTFLQHLSLEYLKLQATSRAQGDEETAELAEGGYETTQFLIRERLSRAKPRVAASARAEPPMNPPGVAW